MSRTLFGDSQLLRIHVPRQSDQKMSRAKTLRMRNIRFWQSGISGKAAARQRQGSGKNKSKKPTSLGAICCVLANSLGPTLPTVSAWAAVGNRAGKQGQPTKGATQEKASQKTGSEGRAAEDETL